MLAGELYLLSGYEEVGVVWAEGIEILNTEGLHGSFIGIIGCVYTCIYSDLNLLRSK